MPCALTIAQAGRLIASREISPVELTRAYLERIDVLDRDLHHYVLVLRDKALDEARRAEAEIAAERYRGPLHGIPIGLKDIIDTEGVVTTAGSRLMADNVPGADAEAWRRLKAAGAILLGKHECYEFAFSSPSPDGLYPPARNPWNPEHSTGGSSSGSGAAVAAGLCMGALGSDTGGSIRIPASFCGITGLKPTYGRVSLRGIAPLAPSLDCCGPMARTAEDCALILQVIAGHDPGDPASAERAVPDYAGALRGDLAGVRVGYLKHFAEDAGKPSGPANNAVEAALGVLSDLGAEIDEVTLPDLWTFSACALGLILHEANRIHADALHSRAGDYAAHTRERLELGALVSEPCYSQVIEDRRALTVAYGALLEQVDILVCAGMTGPAPKLDEIDNLGFLDRPLITAPFNVAGAPAISVCCGFDEKLGLPLAMQIAGRAFDEAAVLRAAYAYQQATGWTDRQPPL